MKRYSIGFVIRALRSASCVVAAVCLICLCIRSYTWMETIGKFGRLLALEHFAGQINLTGNPGGPDRMPLFTFPPRKIDSWNIPTFKAAWNESRRFVVAIPHWFLALAFIGMARALWLRWRFSLRQMLLAVVLTSVAIACSCYYIEQTEPSTPPIAILGPSLHF